MMDLDKVVESPRLVVRAHRRYPVALALVSLLVGGLASVAMARPDGPVHTQRVAAASARPGNQPLDRAPARAAPAPLPSATTAAAARPDDRLALAVPDQPPRRLEVPVAPAALTEATVAAGYVDPAGGHALVRPIETRNPYRGR